MSELNIGIIGHNFMGKAHSNGWLQSSRFFDLPAKPKLKVACGRNLEGVKSFADNWGWESVETDWRKVVENKDIDIIDIALPTHLHHDVAIAAAENGKHIFCEKPMALSVTQSEAMYQAASKNKVVHYLNHNYRRMPAIRLARQLIEEGKLGRIFHWRGAYQQDWIVDPTFPLTWHMQKDLAGSGPHADLNSHSIDLAHYLVGPITSVSCMTTRFIDERPLPNAGAGTFTAGECSGPAEVGPVTVEDASLMHVTFSNGAIGSFEASRFATGRKNHNTFEIYGSEGSLLFDLERLNELQYYSRQDDANAQGFRRILVTENTHPYIDAWWPPGHIIGYEHGFVHAAADFICAIETGDSLEPTFADGVAVMKVIDAGLESAKTKRRIDIL